MPMNAREIETLIKAELPDAKVVIRDLAGDGDHYAAEVVSESFRGKSRVQQHQMVYDALKGNMGGALHARPLQTSVPDYSCAPSYSISMAWWSTATTPTMRSAAAGTSIWRPMSASIRKSSRSGSFGPFSATRC
jgi:stress-induced morphogen